MEPLERIKNEAKESIVVISDSVGLESWRVKFLGRKSELSLFLRSLAERRPEERRTMGAAGNALRVELENLYQNKQQGLGSKGESLGTLDITQPGTKFQRGHIHPLTIAMRRATEIFSRMGFEIVEGPEIETEYYNFNALNIPAWHPARDLMDTFWLRPQKYVEKNAEQRGNFLRESAFSQRKSAVKLLLRAHTSPVQVRYMETHRPPLRIIVPGTVYRHEATDARHEMQFHQIEGLMVGSDVSLANLKAVMEAFLKEFFGPRVQLRMRPGYFPFVEPGVEFDLACIGCYGRKSRCKLCGGGGWLEFMGAGMVHPNVFRAVGYDPARVQGFAFGMGVERLAMIKYKIDDIRLFHSGDLRFVKQF
ncbi:MAG: phenylalanine--tRNA ligase subunit alpha [Parcubacteria group bacterium]|nr:phenylalanine--tRNA ligase subunit alpha [Parcubacteria group bacterium]